MKICLTMSNPIIKILRVCPNMDIPLPQYMTELSAGMDICAAVKEEVVLKAGSIFLVPTGFAVSIPKGFEAQIRPRSGLAVKYGITLVNSPGTIDADYRGEVSVPLINFGKQDYTIRRGDRIAQMVISKVYQAHLKIVEQLDATDRNCGGFGHTGL